MTKSATTDPAQEERASSSGSASAEPFRRAVAAYHDCVGQVVQRYAERLQELNDAYVEAVQKASRAPTYEEQLRALDEATRHYNGASQENIDTANSGVQNCVRTYVESLKAGFGELDPAQVDLGTLTYVAGATTFIAYSAAGASPSAWWLPIDRG